MGVGMIRNFKWSHINFLSPASVVAITMICDLKKLKYQNHKTVIPKVPNMLAFKLYKV